MGLAGFNRSRRSRVAVEQAEAKRFKEDNAARWAAIHGQDKKLKDIDAEAEAIRKLESKASDKIGAKAEAGLETDVADLPLRQDHAAEIAGRTIEDPQGKPVDPVQRVADRIPSGTATEKLVEHMQVDQKGPTKAMVDAAVEEQTPVSERELLKSGDAPKADNTAKGKAEEAAAPEGEANADETETEAEDADATKTEETDKTAGQTAAEAKTKAAAEKAAVETKLPAAGQSAGAGTEAPTSSATGGAAVNKTTTPTKK